MRTYVASLALLFTLAASGQTSISTLTGSPSGGASPTAALETVQTTATTATQRAAKISFAEMGGKCDAVVAYKTSAGTILSTGTTSNGVSGTTAYSASLVPGYTDNTPVWNAMMAKIAASTSQEGYSVETAIQSALTETIIFPDGCHFAVSTDILGFPSGGVIVEGNGVNMVGFEGTQGQKALIKDVNNNKWNVPGRSNATLRNMHILWAGTPWTATSSEIVAGYYADATDAPVFENVSIFGFPICYALGAEEYLHASNPETSHCRVGRWVGTGDDGSNVVNGVTYPGPKGGQSIDNTFIDAKDRGNAINVWHEGSAASSEYGGTASYATVIPYLFGGPLPHWIATVSAGAPANGQAIKCPASSNVHLVTTDSGGGTDAELIYQTNASGTGGKTWISYAGRGYTAASTAITAPACANPPQFAVTTGSMDNWGFYPGQPGRSTGQILVAGKNIEALGTFQLGPTGSGLIASADSTTGGITFRDNQLLPDSGLLFVHIARMDGQGNLFVDNWGTGGTDPWDGTTCGLLGGNAASFVTKAPDALNPKGTTCDMSKGLFNAAKQYANTSDVGGITYGTLGDRTQMAVPVQSSNLGAALVTFTMGISAGENGVNPQPDFAGQPSGAGLPSGASCYGEWRWSGYTSDSKPGTALNRLYFASATCIVDYTGLTQVYASRAAKKLGSESWSLAPLGVGDLNLGNQKATSGTRYACIDTSGHLVASATACSGS